LRSGTVGGCDTRKVKTRTLAKTTRMRHTILPDREELPPSLSGTRLLFSYFASFRSSQSPASNACESLRGSLFMKSNMFTDERYSACVEMSGRSRFAPGVWRKNALSDVCISRRKRSGFQNAR
jgi:hypothetical protein